MEHFDLRRHFRLNTAVERVNRDDAASQWKLDLEGEPSERFDKVLFATGPHVKPTMPKIEGFESFTGTIIHSTAFKRSAAPLRRTAGSANSAIGLLHLPA